ncbi:hypothetical protein H0H92_015885, partial [Tricholoma furcatifolium]
MSTGSVNEESYRNPNSGQISALIDRKLPMVTRIIEHADTGQGRFQDTGQSSCGLAASNFLRSVFNRCKYHASTSKELLEWILSEEAFK